MKAHFIAKLADSCNSLIRFLPLKVIIRLYSFGRTYFMSRYYQTKVGQVFVPPINYKRTLWGLTFRSPLMNSAGMFKNGEGYEVVSAQGAGGYIGGTSTYNVRAGNTVDGIRLPFITLPDSHATINYLGLPNLGDKVLSRKIITRNKICPLGWSVMRSPDYTEQVGLENLIKSLWQYHDNLQIDFLEINESCPNIKHGLDDIGKRLIYIGEQFLAKRQRHLPVAIKLSNDISQDNLKKIMDVLFQYRFDGINLGNTSTDYTYIRTRIVASEVKLFDYFSSKFAGGVGGNALKNKSYDLCKYAVEYKNQINPDYEFHIIRSGGIDNLADIYDSDSIGVSMNQWYSGYFTNYIKNSDLVYKEILNGYLNKSVAMV